MIGLRVTHRGDERFSFDFEADAEAYRNFVRFIGLFHWPPAIEVNLIDLGETGRENLLPHKLEVIGSGGKGFDIASCRLSCHREDAKSLAEGLNANARLAVHAAVVNISEI